MKIIKYEEKYLNEVYSLFYNTIHNVNTKDYTTEQINAWAPEHMDIKLFNDRLLNSYCLLIIYNNKVVAYGSVKEGNIIDHFYVHHSFQGQHFGKILLTQLEEHSNSNFYCTFASITALKFFEANGYIVQYENIVNINGIQLTNFYMRKEV